MVLLAFTRGKVLVPFIDYYSSLWVGKFSVESCSLFHVAPLKVWKLLMFLRQRLMKTMASGWTWQASSFVSLPSLTIYIYTAEWKTAREKTCHFYVKGHQQALAHMTWGSQQSRVELATSTIHCTWPWGLSRSCMMLFGFNAWLYSFVYIFFSIFKYITVVLQITKILFL